MKTNYLPKATTFASSRDGGFCWDSASRISCPNDWKLCYRLPLVITSEFSIRATYCDLAIKLNGKLELLSEVKAIGAQLKDSDIKQPIDYAANQGTEWVILTNAVTWKVFHVTFAKPINHDLVLYRADPTEPQE